MWVFSDFGLLMPAIVPAKHANDPEVLAWTNNGEYELQVRARLREHLEYFMTEHMPEGTYNPIIQATPDKDYNYRFYTTREAFGDGIKSIAMSMDYEKFKDSSLRFKWNDKYHKILTNIWAKLCELNTPGGIWGPKSESNPHGYDKSSKYSSWGRSSWGSEDYEDWHNGSRQIGSSFGNVDFGERYRDEFGPTTEDLDSLLDSGYQLDGVSDMDYTPGWLTRAEDLIREFDRAGIDHEEWFDYVKDDEEWTLIQPEVERRVRAAQKDRRRFKKLRRGGKKNSYAKR